MKYDLNLSDAENRKAWRKHRIDNPGTRYAELSQEERDALGRLNEKLRLMGQRYHEESVHICAELDRRVNNPLDWLQDYEVELKVSLYLRDDDPEFEDEDDNILWVQEELLSHADPLLDWGVSAIHVNHAFDHDLYGFDKDQFHCYLYHSLYYCGKLGWRDLLRVGCIWADLVVTYQEHCKLGIKTMTPI